MSVPSAKGIFTGFCVSTSRRVVSDPIRNGRGPRVEETRLFPTSGPQTPISRSRPRWRPWSDGTLEPGQWSTETWSRRSKKRKVSREKGIKGLTGGTVDGVSIVEIGGRKRYWSLGIEVGAKIRNGVLDDIRILCELSMVYLGSRKGCLDLEKDIKNRITYYSKVHWVGVLSTTPLTPGLSDSPNGLNVSLANCLYNYLDLEFKGLSPGLHGKMREGKLTPHWTFIKVIRELLSKHNQSYPTRYHVLIIRDRRVTESWYYY